ncbi:MAG: TonB-dependent receptor [Bacteroidales bacterium]|nr:TonB-dependent receptor [Bacteroidales bacterium]
MKVSSIVMLLLLVVGQLNEQGQYNLQGTVHNKNKEPIPYATIHIVNKNIFLLSDSNGTFFFVSSPNEKIKLQISAMGYEAKEWEFTVTNDREQYLFTLPEGVIVLGEVVVSGDSRRDTQMKSSQNIVRVEKSFIEENFSGSLMQTLETIPGVKAMRIGSGLSKPTIRGLGFNRMIVAENGIKHEGQQWGEDHGLEIDQFSVDEVEVIKGPSSLLYGSDAIGGVISLRNNYIPQIDFGGRVNFFTRSNNKSFGLHTQLAGKKNRFYYKANLTLTDYADYKVPTDSIQYHSYYIKLKDLRLRNTAGNEKNVGLNLGYISDKFNTSLQVANVYAKSGFFADAHGLEVRLSDIDYDKSDRDIDLPFHSVNHFKLVNNSTWNIRRVYLASNLSFQNNLRKEFTEPVSHGYMPIPPDSLERKFNKNIYTANIHLKYLLADKHSLEAGINTEYQYNRRGGWGFIIPDFETASIGGYVLDRYHISNNLIASVGIRFDRIRTNIHSYRDWYKTPVNETEFVYKERSANLKRTFNSLSWSSGINYNIGVWNLKANIGKSFRVPIPKELGSDGINYHIFRYEKGEPDLSPEESYQFDAGVSWQTARITIQLSPYLNYFPNYIYLNPTPNYYEGLQMYYYTQSKVIRCGFEAEFDYKLTEIFSIDLKGEYLYVKQLSGDKKGYALPFSPPASADIGIKYIPDWKWFGTDGAISVSYKIVGAQNEIVPPESKTKGYQTFDMALATSFKWNNNNIRINLQSQNLLNKKYFDHTSYYRLIDVPEPGRNFSLMIGFDF